MSQKTCGSYIAVLCFGLSSQSGEDFLSFFPYVGHSALSILSLSVPGNILELSARFSEKLALLLDCSMPRISTAGHPEIVGSIAWHSQK